MAYESIKINKESNIFSELNYFNVIGNDKSKR